MPGQRGHRGRGLRQGHRAADPHRQRPDAHTQSLGAVADGGGQDPGVEGGHLPHPQRVQPGPLRGQRDGHRLLVGAVEPVGENRLDSRLVHSVVVSTGWSSSTRPSSSREAALTWMWASMVNASRSRRWSGEPS